MFGNLLDNAVKYTPDGGRIDVSLTQDAAGRACVQIADSGPGIPADERERVFDRFYRDSSARAGGRVGQRARARDRQARRGAAARDGVARRCGRRRPARERRVPRGRHGGAGTVGICVTVLARGCLSPA
jgi:hypothetical protein